VSTRAPELFFWVFACLDTGGYNAGAGARASATLPFGQECVPMPWGKNKRLVAEGFSDLAYLPKGRSGWDFTLASLAYGVRRDIARRAPDLNAWAARHGVPASARYQELGANALVLWHGTSCPRAEKIAEHGLFHKKGLWTTLDPRISHGFCRSRSEPFEATGAVVCLVLDRRQVAEGKDYDVEGKGDVFRFHYGLPPDVVEYVLMSDAIRFTGAQAASEPKPWRRAAFKRHSGQWAPMQKAPVRYSEAASYSSVAEFAAICLSRFAAELGQVAALEVFSSLYALVEPRDALEHDLVLSLLDARWAPRGRRGKWQTLCPVESGTPAQ